MQALTTLMKTILLSHLTKDNSSNSEALTASGHLALQLSPKDPKVQASSRTTNLKASSKDQTDQPSTPKDSKVSLGKAKMAVRATINQAMNTLAHRPKVVNLTEMLTLFPQVLRNPQVLKTRVGLSNKDRISLAKLSLSGRLGLTKGNIKLLSTTNPKGSLAIKVLFPLDLNSTRDPKVLASVLRNPET